MRQWVAASPVEALPEVLSAFERQVRLAPSHDMASMHPYADQVHPRQLRMSMKIGGEYRWHAIRDEHRDRLRESMEVG